MTDNETLVWRVYTQESNSYGVKWSHRDFENIDAAWEYYNSPGCHFLPESMTLFEILQEPTWYE